MGCSQCRAKTDPPAQILAIAGETATFADPQQSNNSLEPSKKATLSDQKVRQPRKSAMAVAYPNIVIEVMDQEVQTSASLVDRYMKELKEKQQKQNQKDEVTEKLTLCPSSKKLGSSGIRVRRQSFVRTINENVNNRYLFQAKLGQGSYGCVFKCVDKTTRSQRAIKVIKKRTLKNSSNFFAELDILRTLDHPSIIKLYQVYDHGEFYYVVTEYCSGGELFQVVRGVQRMTQRNVAVIMKQILSAVNYMHKKNIMHRDLKPENIVLEYRPMKETIKDPPIKIIDFGTATTFQPGKYLKDQVGSPYYVAPDVLEGRYNEKCDMWSCGIILYTLLCGSPPFRGKTLNQILDNIKKSSPSYEERIWPRISAGARDLVKCLLQKKPEKRITAEQALSHAWIQSCDSNQAIDSHVLQNLQVFYFKNKFLAIIETYLATNAVSQQDRRILAQKFQQLDKDQSGSIQTAELVEAFKTIYGEKYTEQAIKQIIDNIDSNGSGKIDFTEFIVAISTKQKLFQKKSLQNAFNFFDKDKTGFLQVTELKALLGNSSDEEVKQLMQKLDANGDQKISKDEFVDKLQLL